MILNKDFFNYPAFSEKDSRWGTVVTALGHSKILPNSNYPPLQHPKSHQFSIHSSRRVTEYQIIYITEGEGFFEAENGIKCNVKAGTIFMLFPGVLHRYYPSKSTGWTEYYVGFSGINADNLLEQGFISTDKPIFEIGLHEALVQLYDEIFQIVNNGMVGYQQSAAGVVWHLLGEILFLEKNKRVDSSTEQLIQNVKTALSERVAEKIDWHTMSRVQGVSYSKLRKEFKAYVGMSPGQYQLLLRINKAKIMLSQTLEPIKSIAHALGFQNEYYFNTIFKKKAGAAPGAYRSASTEMDS